MSNMDPTKNTGGGGGGELEGQSVPASEDLLCYSCSIKRGNLKAMHYQKIN